MCVRGQQINYKFLKGGVCERFPAIGGDTEVDRSRDNVNRFMARVLVVSICLRRRRKRHVHANAFRVAEDRLSVIKAPVLNGRHVGSSALQQRRAK